jgi:probable F420-dependent oxidoreductase
MRYGISVPNFDQFGDPRAFAELAREAEAAGWDGVFIWDHIAFWKGFRAPVSDPWVALSAAAMTTERVKLGPMVTPVARRRPWLLARQAVSLDHLSGGRLILGVGLGHPPDAEFEAFGEEGDARVRAEKLDEGLEVITGLWRGEEFSYQGKHFQVHETIFQPPPVQQPRIPIWVAGAWPRKAPFRRAARWDGVFPISLNVNWDEVMPPDELRAVVAYVREQRATSAPFDVILGGATTGADRAKDADLVAQYTDAGLSWWIEGIPGYRGSFEGMRQRVRLGPPGR